MTQTSQPRSRADELDDLLRLQVQEDAEWARLGVKSRRYYHNHQWDDAQILEGEQRLRITAQVIRRDIDNQKARIADAEPTMETQGRGPEDWDMGQLWRDLLRWSERWTGRHDSAYEVRDKVYDDSFQVGEGVEKITWDADEEGGLGMVVSEWVDPFHVIWDPCAKSIQRRDAAWICHFEPVEIEELERKFPKLKGKIKEDCPSFFTGDLTEKAADDDYATRGRTDGTSVSALRRKPKAYRKEWWFKKPIKTRRFFLNGHPAQAPLGDEMVELTEEAYDALPPEAQEQFDVHDSVRYELRTAVQINSLFAIPEHVSEYDETEGGDSEYPFAFYPGVWDPTQAKCHGEIEYLMGFQDVINHTTSRYLEAMFLANSQWLETEIGAYPRNEESKFQWVGRRAFQRIRKYPGTKSAEWRTANPVSAQLYQAGVEWIKNLKDENSGIRDVNRAAPQYDLSGVAVRSLQADADLLGTQRRIHMESGLRQATMLRIARLQQFFRVARVIRILPQAASDEQYNLYVGQSQQRVEGAFNLRPEEQTVQGANGPVSRQTGFMVNPAGQKGKTLIISDPEIRKFDLKLQLTSGRERDKEERKQLVQTMLQYTGPAAGPGLLKWAGKLLEIPDRETFEAELDNADQARRVVQQVEQIQQQAGMSLDDLAMLAQQLKAQRAAASAAPPGGAPPGAPGGMQPPGPPPQQMGVAA